MRVRITDIAWETDGVDPQELDLPTGLTVDTAAKGIDDVEPELADWLSDRYGWLVRGFTHAPANTTSDET